MPPKKQKKTSKSSFYYFMMDFKEMQGNNFRNMQQVSDAAGRHWERMSKQQRSPYEERALFEKNNRKRCTSDGVNIEILERTENEAAAKIKQMQSNINDELSLAAKDGNIKDKMLFLVHINHFCYCSSQNKYYPAEIAILGFNLVDGVQPENVYHRMINPGSLPLGYASEALLISNESHQIPPPFGEKLVSNMEEVYVGMKEFLQTKVQGSDGMPVLYCHDKYMKMVQDILDMWRDAYKDNTSFTVYNLQYMFHVLKNAVAGTTVWPTDTFSYTEIAKDVNAFVNDIACEYHEQTCVPNHCSRSIVIRCAYTICDNCCQDLQISLIFGCHVPQMGSLIKSRPPSVTSAMSRSSKSKASSIKSVGEDDSVSVISTIQYDLESLSVISEVSTVKDDFDLLDVAAGESSEMALSTNSVCEDDSDSEISFSIKSDLESHIVSEVSTMNEDDEFADAIEDESNSSPCHSKATSSLDGPSCSKTEAGASGTAHSRPTFFEIISNLANRVQTFSIESTFCSVCNSSRTATCSNHFVGVGRGARKKTRDVTRPNDRDLC